MPNNHSAKQLADAIDEAQARLAPQGAMRPADVGQSAIDVLSKREDWPALRDSLVSDLATATARRRMARAARAVDIRQGWLGLQEYDCIPQLIKVHGAFLDLREATLEEYRESSGELAARIHSYLHPRRNEKKLKRDKQELAQRRKLDANVAAYFANAPGMKMGLAIEMHFASLETPKVERWRKGGKAKAARTKNQ